jgi:hypothetical protein
VEAQELKRFLSTRVNKTLNECYTAVTAEHDDHCEKDGDAFHIRIHESVLLNRFTEKWISS